MEEDLNLTIKILREQKNKYISILQDTNDLNNSNAMEILDNIYKIDQKIKEYKKDVKDDNKAKIFEEDDQIKTKVLDTKNSKKKYTNNSLKKKNIKYVNNKENQEDYKSEKTDSDNDNINIKTQTNIKKKIIPTKYEIELTKEQIDKILAKEGKTNLVIYDNRFNIEITYNFKIKKNKVIYYQCNRRPKCKGSSKFEIDSNKFYKLNKCDTQISHSILNYDKLKELIDNNKVNLIDFTEKKNQLLFVQFLFSEKNILENIGIKKEFVKYSKNKFLLTNKEISYIKSKINGTLRNLSLEECVHKLKDPIYNLEIYSTDIKYSIKTSNNNKEKDRTQKKIVFGIKDRFEYFKNKNIKEYFIDITFQIIPKCYRPYKLMTITSLDPLKNHTIIICFVLLVFTDSLSYQKIFHYLNENFCFDPLIIHTDYEVSLALAIKESKFFRNKILHIRCLFHLIKAIRDKCKSLGLCNKKLSKEMYAVIKNIEIICFIQKDKIDEYQNFLIDNLKKNKKYTKLVTYLKNYWFKKKVE